MEAIKAELERLAATGLLLPPAVVDAARDPKSPLHDHFTWDDGEAAEKYRLVEARSLIARVKVQMVGANSESYNVRQFAHLSTDKRGYRNLSDVAKAPDMVTVLRQDLARDLQRAVAKYRATVAVIDAPELFSTIDAFVNSMLLSQTEQRKAS